MAFLRMQDGTCKTVSHEKAVTMFRVQQGTLQGSVEQQAYCKRIHKVYLSRELAPADYKAKYPRIGDLLQEAEQMPLQYKDAA